MKAIRLFDNICKATFISRPNRFLVRCALGGRTVSAFLPNPGRLAELLIPGCRIYLVKVDEADFHNNPSRKTRYTAVAVERGGHPIVLHTHRTNDMARYLIESDLVPGLEGARISASEVRVGQSRIDFLLEQKGVEILLPARALTTDNAAMIAHAGQIRYRGGRRDDPRRLDARARIAWQPPGMRAQVESGREAAGG